MPLSVQAASSNMAPLLKCLTFHLRERKNNSSFGQVIFE